jgi:O-antigen ligase
VFLQIGFSAYERVTGNVNIAAAKGNMASENVGSQYKVLGIENEIRVAGTTNDSHTLGLYYAMLLPLMFVLIVFKNTPRFMRLMAMLALGGGLVGLIITFSRSGWLAFAIAAMVAGGFVIFSWKRGKMVLAAVLVLFIATLFYPKGYEYVYRRVFEAPSELVTARVELMETAYELWKSSPIIGVGPGNYVEAFKAMNMVQEQALEGLPVHNSYLYTLAELGLLGFVGFFGAILLSLRSALLVHRHETDLAKAVALGLFAGFIGYLVDGLTDPMYRELPVYMQLWFAIGLVAALRRESDAARLQDQRDSSAARVGAQMD